MEIKEYNNPYFYKVLDIDYLLIDICEYFDSVYDLVRLITLNNTTLELKNKFSKLLTECIMKRNLSILFEKHLKMSFDKFIKNIIQKFGLVLSGSSILWSICGQFWGRQKNLGIKYTDGYENFDSHKDIITSFPNDFDLYINTDKDSTNNFKKNFNFLKEMSKMGFKLLCSTNNKELKRFLRSLQNLVSKVIGSDFFNMIKIPPLFYIFLKELRSIEVDKINQNIEKCYNILFKYRIIIISFLKQCNCQFDYDLFGIFRFTKKINIGGGKFSYTNVQIILNDDFSNGFNNFDFQFLKSYLVASHNTNYQFIFNNSLSSILSINQNNQTKPYIHGTANRSPKKSHICFNEICNIKYSINTSYRSLKYYKRYAIKYMTDAIIRQLKYSSRGFNCLSKYLQLHWEDIWFIYDFYLARNENTARGMIFDLINKIAHKSICDCYLSQKYTITTSNDDDKSD